MNEWTAVLVEHFWVGLGLLSTSKHDMFFFFFYKFAMISILFWYKFGPSWRGARFAQWKCHCNVPFNPSFLPLIYLGMCALEGNCSSILSI